MAKLRFTFGTMGSGKSTQALQIHHNLRARGLTTLLMTQLDRREGRVSSRLGVSADAEIVEPSSDLFDLIRQRAKSLGHLNAVICDEVQFYQPAQCEQLARVVDELRRRRLHVRPSHHFPGRHVRRVGSADGACRHPH
jgi:thymidine kinase